MQENGLQLLAAINTFETSEPGMAVLDAMDRTLDRIERSLEESRKRWAERDDADDRGRALRAIGTDLVGADMSLRPKVWGRDPRLDGERTSTSRVDVFESVLLAGSVTVPEAARAEMAHQRATNYADALLPSRVIRAVVPSPGKVTIAGPTPGERWYNRFATRAAVAAGAAALLLGAASAESRSADQPTRADTPAVVQTNAR